MVIRRYKLPGFPGHVSRAQTLSFDSKMVDEQGKLSNCGGNRGFLVGTRHIIFTKCSLSCGQHSAGHVHVKISWHLFVFIKL